MLKVAAHDQSSQNLTEIRICPTLAGWEIQVRDLLSTRLHSSTKAAVIHSKVRKHQWTWFAETTQRLWCESWYCWYFHPRLDTECDRETNRKRNRWAMKEEVWGIKKETVWRNSSLNYEQHSHVVVTRTTEMKSRQYNLMMVLHHFWVSFHCYGMTERLIHHSRVPILHFTEKKSYYTRVRKYWKNRSENDINERWEKQLKPGQTVSLICDGWRLQRQFVPLAQQSKEMNGVHKRENVRLIPQLNLQLSAYPYCFAAHGLSTKGPLWCAPDMWWKSGVPTEIGFAAPPLLSLSCSPTLRVPSRRSECSLAGVRLLKRKGI